ncbi:MAG: hypothetical protein OHK0022_32450 [Roseiflexaceae bacterium]
MVRRAPLVLALVLLGAFCWVRSAGAGAAIISYNALRPCYEAGKPLPGLSLTVRVGDAGTYRVTHQVTLSGSPPGTARTVFDGALEANQTRTISLPGGTAVVPGSYSLTAALYNSSGAMLAQVTDVVRVATGCPLTPTPGYPPPASPPSVKPAEPEAAVRWSQALTTTALLGQRPAIALLVRAFNDGQGSGPSEAVMSYDPNVLELIDVTPQRDTDWVRSRNDNDGTLVITLGDLAPEEQMTLRVRFVVRRSIATSVRLSRVDGRDRANPVLLVPERRGPAPVVLGVRRSSDAVVITGAGYKPGEPLVAWVNTRRGQVVALDGRWIAGQDDNGNVELTLVLPPEEIASVVVYGRWSSVLGVAPMQGLSTSRTSQSINPAQ